MQAGVKDPVQRTDRWRDVCDAVMRHRRQQRPERLERARDQDGDVGLIHYSLGRKARWEKSQRAFFT
jgi:hypothetical protein